MASTIIDVTNIKELDTSADSPQRVVGSQEGSLFSRYHSFR